MDNRHRRVNQRYGFTLAEAVVVVGVVTLLTSIPAASVGRSRERARRAVCAANQKQIVAAAHLYAQENDDVLPLFISRTQHRECSNLFWFQVYGSDPEDLKRLGGICGLGLLTRAGIIADHKTLFCPSGFRVYPITQDSLWAAYYWRPYSTSGARNHWQKLERQPPRKALTADVFAMHSAGWGRGPQDFWHVDGMMVGRVDSSVTWAPDYGNMIRYGLEPGGMWYQRPRPMMNYVWIRLDQDLGW